MDKTDRPFWLLLLLVAVIVLGIRQWVVNCEPDTAPSDNAPFVESAEFALNCDNWKKQTTPSLVVAARKLIGTEYRAGGRLSEIDPGLDRIGLLFKAFEKAFGIKWGDLKVDKLSIVSYRHMGELIPGMDGVPIKTANICLLEPGDLIFLLGPQENPQEAHQALINGKPHWIWHMGIYSGKGKWIHADSHIGQVIEVDLLKYLNSHSQNYKAFWCLRPKEENTGNDEMLSVFPEQQPAQPASEEQGDEKKELPAAEE